jgi:ATP-dependent protease ClpP protease subunit
LVNPVTPNQLGGIMAFEERKKLIQKLEKIRKSKIITYITSDRKSYPPSFSLPGLTTQLASEAQIFLYNQLRSIGTTEKLDLFLYTRGGETNSVWPLVNIFREYSEDFSVIVPFRAHSAGTLVCLGADKIVMSEAAELSPVDPTTGNQFNPVDEIDKRTRRGISVEDVIAYMELAKDPSKVGLQDSDHILEVFKKLSEEVHPIALGNVNRAHTQSRELATKLLKLHMTSEEDKARIEEIVDDLTKNLHSHSHAINRNEAKDIFGKNIDEPSEEEQNLIWQLYEEYEKTLKLKETFCVDSLILSNNQNHDLELNGAFIETENNSLVYKSECHIELKSKIPQQFKIQIQPGQPMPLIPGFPVDINVKVESIGWKNNEKGV